MHIWQLSINDKHLSLAITVNCTHCQSASEMS